MHTLTVRLLYASDCAANDCALADATVSMTWAFDDFLSAEELQVSSRSMLFKSFLEIAIRSNDFLTCKKEERVSNMSFHALIVPQSGMNSKIKLFVSKQEKKKWEIFSFIYVTHMRDASEWENFLFNFENEKYLHTCRAWWWTHEEGDG